jgi:queuosine precursor transporter
MPASRKDVAEPSSPASLPDGAPRTYRYYDLVMAAFVTVLLCSGIIGVTKVTRIWGVSFGTAILFFPLSYLFGDILTEVYGYARSRRVIWAGFTALGFASLMSWIVRIMPAAPGWPHQAAYDTIFGQTPRIVAASLIAFWCGEFANSYVLAKVKILTSGRFLWVRTIGSTIAGEAVDSLVFYPGAFWGVWPADLVFRVMVANYFIKVLWEALATPVTYKVVAFLKRAEREDYYDRNTNFNPFHL